MVSSSFTGWTGYLDKRLLGLKVAGSIEVKHRFLFVTLQQYDLISFVISDQKHVLYFSRSEDWKVLYFFKCKLTFDDRQAAPLDLLPAAAQQPCVDFLQQRSQVLRVRLHDLVKLSKLAAVHECKVSHDTTCGVMVILFIVGFLLRRLYTKYTPFQA